MFDKKGRTVSHHLILWIPKFVYLVVAFLSVLFLLRLLIVTHIDASNAEAGVLINRIFYSPNIISYLDKDIGRAYTGEIDLEKYKQLQGQTNEMDTKTITYGEDNRLIAAKLTLKNMETNVEELVFYNKEDYEFWEPRILPTVKGGSGSVKSFSEQSYVLIKDQDKMHKGILRIDVIVRK